MAWQSSIRWLASVPSFCFISPISQAELALLNLASGEKYKRPEHESDRLIRRTKISVSSATTMVSVTRAASTAFSAIRTSASPSEWKTCKVMESKWLPSKFRKYALFAFHERNSSFFMQKVISSMKKTWRPTILPRRKWVASLISRPPSQPSKRTIALVHLACL